MLSNLRKDEYLYPVPKFDLKKGDFKELMNELKGFTSNLRMFSA